MPNHEYQIVSTSCADSASAQGLVEARSATAVNILPAGKSVYAWRQKVRTASEHRQQPETTRKSRHTSVRRILTNFRPSWQSQSLMPPVTIFAGWKIHG